MKLQNRANRILMMSQDLTITGSYNYGFVALSFFTVVPFPCPGAGSTKDQSQWPVNATAPCMS